MLAFTGPERKILGVDYDSEKIDVASACISRTENMEFACGDVTTYDFPQSDAFVISDVLHYLEEEQQVRLIQKCIACLKPGGMMIIRDANRDLAKRHWGTRYTEFFSTRIAGFNKTGSRGLHFISAKTIEQTLLASNRITFETIDNTKLTSNIIFVVKHNPLFGINP